MRNQSAGLPGIAKVLICLVAAGCHHSSKEGVIDYPHPADPTPAPEPPVGEPFLGVLNGQLGVGTTGAATYTVPISIPPGVAGMAPNLNLVYGSQASDGIAGQGWTLAGLSMIHRCPRTRVQDGIARQVHMNATDQAAETESNVDGLCLDGKRLFARGQGVYETESKDFSTITSHSQPGSTTVSPEYFTVVTKGGETRYYGSRPDACVSFPREDDTSANPPAEVAVWALDRVMDAWGNYYDLHYNRDQAGFSDEGLLVTEIDYTGHVSGSAAPDSTAMVPSQPEGEVPPFHAITFDYEARPDVRHTRFRSSTLPQNYRLTAISTPLGSYSLSYAADDDPMLPSRLASIGYCTTEGCLDPLTFDWDGGDFGWQPVPHATDVGQEQSYELPDRIDRKALDFAHMRPVHGTQLVDLDGDGLVDFIEAQPGSFGAWQNNGHGWTTRGDWVLPAILANADGTQAGTLLADVDGDGIVDLVSDASACQLASGQRLCVWLNRIKTGGGWVNSASFGVLPTSWGAVSLTTTHTLADMNADGRADLVFVSGGTDMRVLISTGAGWVTPAQSYDTTPVGPTSGLHLEDLNRDGLLDLVGADNTSARVAGINTGTNGLNGTVWERTTSQADSNVQGPLGSRVLGDIDGDGFPDPVSLYTGLAGPLFPDLTPRPAGQVQDTGSVSGSPSVAFATGLGYTSNGTDGFVSALVAFGPDPSVTLFPAWQLPNYLFATADLNGDGLADLIIGHLDGGQVLANTGSTWRDVNGYTTRQGSAGPSGVPVVPTDNPMFAGSGATFVDLDGDGVTDLVQSQGNLPGGRITHAWLNKFRPPVITGFPNGLAHKTQVAYSVITTADAKSKGIYSDTDALAPGTTYLALPLRVVSSISRDDGLELGTVATTSYQYRSLRGSASGRGPQGFRQIWSEDQAGIETVTTYAQAYPYTGLPTSVSRSKRWVGGGIPLTSTETAYCDSVVTSALGETPSCSPISGVAYAPGTSAFVYPLSVTDTTTLLGGLSGNTITPTTLLSGLLAGGNMITTTQLRYDDQGNPTSTTVTTVAPTGETYQKGTVNSYGAAGSPEQKLGKLTRAVVTTQRMDDGSAAITHTTEFDYGEVASFYASPGITRSSTLGLKKKRVEPGAGAPLELDTAYAYDRFGNVTTTTDCAADFANCVPGANSSGPVPFRTTRVSYDPKDFAAPEGSGLVGSLKYGAGRFPVKVTNAAGHAELSAYDGETGLLLQKTGPNGITTCHRYDTFSRQISETARCGSDAPLETTTAQYLTTEGDQHRAKVVTVTRPPTGAATWAYTDSLGRQVYTLARSFDGGFTESFTGYDALGRLRSESKPRPLGTNALYMSIRAYDILGRVSTVTQQLGGVDGSGGSVDSVVTTTFLGSTIQTDHQVNGIDQSRSETKNALGKVASVTDANGAVISYRYDADGNLTDTRDPQGNVVHIEYDTRGRKVLTRDPDLGEWSYVYDGFGDLMSQTDAKGQTIAMTYDVLGRLTSKTDPMGTASWVYDVAPGAGVGKLAAMLSAPDSRLEGSCAIPQLASVDGGHRSARSFIYTDGGDLKEELSCADGDSFSTEYEYDALGRQSVVRYPAVNGSRFAVGYHYTSLGFLHYLTDESDHSIYWIAAAMNALGQVTDERTRNGVQTLSTRDPSTGWLMASKTAAHTPGGDTLIQGWSYQFDVAGNLLGRARAATPTTPGSQESFGYDALNRLTGSDVAVAADAADVTAGASVADGSGSPANAPVVGGSHVVASYAYDSVGNLTQKDADAYTYGSGCQAGQRPAGPHAVCTVGSRSPFSYDANGNVVSGNNRTITYNTGNKPTRIDGGAAGAADFIYGADSNRIVQEISAAAGDASGRTVYVGLGGTGKSLYERTTRGTTAEHVQFIYAGGAHGGNAFAVRVTTDGAATTKYNHFDHLGSVTAVSDENGRIDGAPKPAPDVDFLGYDPWGARRNSDGHLADEASVSHPAGRREFTSHETIPGLGLVNMNGRVYDPSLGRFLSPDPNVQFIADLQSYNRYSYVQNNPLRYTDPTGYFVGGGFDLCVEYGLTLVALYVCPYTEGAGCAIAFAIAGATYGTASMIHSGAPWGQAITVNLASMFAGFVGGQLGAGIGNAVAGGAAGQLIGGAIGGAMSAAMTTAMFGGSLGKNVLMGAAEGAAGAALAWAGAGGGGLSEASTDEGGGSGEARIEKAETVDSVLTANGVTGRPIPAEEALFDADTADLFRAGGTDPYEGQAATRVAATGYIGVTVTGQAGAPAGGWFYGLAIDDSGNLAWVQGPQFGIGVGSRGAAGLQLQFSDAAYVTDLGRMFYGVSNGAGAGPYASIEGFWGSSDHGYVHGMGLTVGAGVGGGSSAGGSYTYVTPIAPTPSNPVGSWVRGLLDPNSWVQSAR